MNEKLFKFALFLIVTMVLLGCEKQVEKLQADKPQTASPANNLQQKKWNEKFPNTTFNEMLDLECKALFRAEMRDNALLARELVVTLNRKASLKDKKIQYGIYQWSDEDSSWNAVNANCDVVTVGDDLHVLLDFGPVSAVFPDGMGMPFVPDKFRMVFFTADGNPEPSQGAYEDILADAPYQARREDEKVRIKSVYGTAADCGNTAGGVRMFVPSVTSNADAIKQIFDRYEANKSAQIDGDKPPN